MCFLRNGSAGRSCKVRGSRDNRRPAIFLALIAMSLALAGCEEWFSHWRAFEVTVDLTVEGQRKQITRQIMCQGEVKRDIGMRARVLYKPTARAFGERLPSGGAVMVVTPQLCVSAHRTDESTSDVIQISKGHIPYIGWTDNADHPNIIEAYVSPGYFKRRNGRVRYHGMIAKVINVASVNAGPVDEFEWFGGGHSGLRHSFNVVSIPEHDWRALEGVSAALKEIKSFSRLPDKLNSQIGAAFPLVYGASRLYGGLGLVGTPSPDRPYLISRLPTEWALILNTFFPLFEEDGRFVMKPQEQGYFVFYRSNVDAEPDETGSTLNFQVGEGNVVLPATGRSPMAVYDPNRKIVFSVKAVPIRFPSNNPL